MNKYENSNFLNESSAVGVQPVMRSLVNESGSSYAERVQLWRNELRNSYQQVTNATAEFDTPDSTAELVVTKVPSRGNSHDVAGNAFLYNRNVIFYDVLSDPAVQARAEEYARLLDKIYSFTQGAGGESTVSTLTAQIAKNLLAAMEIRVDFPCVSASGDGEVFFSWFARSSRLDAAVDPDGYLTWSTIVDDCIRPGRSVDMSSFSFDRAASLLFGIRHLQDDRKS